MRGLEMRKSHGFTLIELILVMALLGILLAVLIPNLYPFLDGIVLKTEAQKIALVIQQTQQLAKLSGEYHFFEIHTSEKFYRIRNFEGTVIKEEINSRIHKITSNFPGYSGGDANLKILTFTSTGTPGGRTGNIQLFLKSGKSSTVHVAAVTGRVRIE